MREANYKTCKTCRKCFEDIETHFYRRSSTKDGFSSQCRSCYNREGYSLRKRKVHALDGQSKADNSLFRKNLEFLLEAFSSDFAEDQYPRYITVRRAGSPSADPKGLRIVDTERGLFLSTDLLTGLSGVYLSRVSHHRLAELISRESLELVGNIKN